MNIHTKLEPSTYARFVSKENNSPILYVRLVKALYSMLTSALLFYKQFKNDIGKVGFHINPYDPCIANKIVNGKQQTIVWHVNDIKPSHKHKEVNDNFLK